MDGWCVSVAFSFWKFIFLARGEGRIGFFFSSSSPFFPYLPSRPSLLLLFIPQNAQRRAVYLRRRLWPALDRPSVPGPDLLPLHRLPSGIHHRRIKRPRDLAHGYFFFDLFSFHLLARPCSCIKRIVTSKLNDCFGNECEIGELPMLHDGKNWIAGTNRIIAYLSKTVNHRRNHATR